MPRKKKRPAPKDNKLVIERPKTRGVLPRPEQTLPDKKKERSRHACRKRPRLPGDGE